MRLFCWLFGAQGLFQVCTLKLGVGINIGKLFTQLISFEISQRNIVFELLNWIPNTPPIFYGLVILETNVEIGNRQLATSCEVICNGCG